jgi:hypothetical protein
VLSAAPGQPKGGKKKHHDTIRDMIAASSHVFFFLSLAGASNGYMAVGYLLFLHEPIKDIIIIYRSINRSKSKYRFRCGRARTQPCHSPRGPELVAADSPAAAAELLPLGFLYSCSLLSQGLSAETEIQEVGRGLSLADTQTGRYGRLYTQDDG